MCGTIFREIFYKLSYFITFSIHKTARFMKSKTYKCIYYFVDTINFIHHSKWHLPISILLLRCKINYIIPYGAFVFTTIFFHFHTSFFFFAFSVFQSNQKHKVLRNFLSLSTTFVDITQRRDVQNYTATTCR